MAESPQEEQRRRRRRRIVRGLLLGGAAVGVPALLNALVSRRVEALPTPRWGEGQCFDSRWGKVVYRRLGQGPPVVFLHSFGPGHSSLEWRAVAEALATEYRIYAPDLLGWGESAGSSRTFDSELYIRLVADFLADVVGERALVVAAGMSGAYAVQVAVDHPERVRALGLVVPLGIGLNGDGPDLKDAILYRILRLPVVGTSALNVFTGRGALAGYLRREVFARPDKVGDALVDEHYHHSHHPGARAALAAFLSGYLNHGVHDALTRLEPPVWLGWGRRALSPAVEMADLWLRTLQDADFEVFEDCGILPHRETPRRFAKALSLFFAKIAP
jgi:pimeloyl-ACP methyl ester carboxylesterase